MVIIIKIEELAHGEDLLKLEAGRAWNITKDVKDYYGYSNTYKIKGESIGFVLNKSRGKMGSELFRPGVELLRRWWFTRIRSAGLVCSATPLPLKI